MDKFKTVRTYDNSVEANLAKNYLIENGIEASLTDEFVGEIFSTAIKGIRLVVPADQYEEAEGIISALSEDVSDGDKSEVTEILEDSEALLNGHFQLTSGLHSQQYIEKIKVINKPEHVETLCKMLADNLKNYDADIVIGLAMGGIVLGYEVAKSLGKRFAFSQRKDGVMTFRQGFDLQPGMKAIIIEDIVTTGSSVKEVVALLNRLELDVLAVGLLVDRSGGQVDFGVPTIPLLTLSIEAFQPDDCPLCAKNVPLSRPGSSDRK